MRRWEQVEDYINDSIAVGQTFTSIDYANDQGISRPEASKHIQAYLISQRGAKSRTKYVLKRQVGTRTSNARWTVGKRATDARRTGMAFSDDVRAKWKGAVEPDLLRIAAINPKAAHRVEVIIDATLDGAMKVLEAAVRA